MKRCIAIFLFLTATAMPLWPHPLGNFSINQFSRIDVSAAEIRIHQVLDLAEIPTFQRMAEIDTDHNGDLSADELSAWVNKISPDYLEGVSLTVGGNKVPLKLLSANAVTSKGAGDLLVVRAEWEILGDLNASADLGRIRFENDNYPGRVGWNEMVVGSHGRITIFNSSAYGSTLSDELRSYPADLLASPLNERSADFFVTSGPVPEGAKVLATRDGHEVTPASTDKLASLISLPTLTPSIIAVSLLIAFGLGALHAMSPGHGKTVVGAYLVGSRGTPWHAAFLGLTVTFTHTIGVFALGLVTLFASNYILPERIMPFLSFISGLLVFYIGITLFKSRLFSILGWQSDEHHHVHSHDHEEMDGAFTHTHDGHTHSHAPPADMSWRSLIGLGISGGLLPCPSALVLMLSAISLGRIAYGLVLTLAFSFGLAATLMTVGILFLFLGRAFGGSLGQNRFVKAIPVLSALVIAGVGATICISSFA